MALLLAMVIPHANAAAGGGAGGGGAGGAGGGAAGGIGGGAHAGAIGSHGSAGIYAGIAGRTGHAALTGKAPAGRFGVGASNDINLDRAIDKELGTDTKSLGESGNSKGAASANAVDRQLAQDIAKFDAKEGLKTGGNGSLGGTAGATAGTSNPTTDNPGSNNSANTNQTNQANNPANPNSPQGQQTLMEEQQFGTAPGTTTPGAGGPNGTTANNQSSTSPFSSVSPPPATSTAPVTTDTTAGTGTEGSPSQGSALLGSTNMTALRNYFLSNRPEGPSVPVGTGGVAVAVGESVPQNVALNPLPDSLKSDLPPGNYAYFTWGDDVVIADADTRNIVAVLPGIS